MSETTNVRRYRIDGSHGEFGRWTYHGMERDEAGSWVPYDDHAAALAAARREVETVTTCSGCGAPRLSAILACVRGQVACCPDCSTLTMDERNTIRGAISHLALDLAASRAALEDVRRVETFWSGDTNHVRCEWVDAIGGRVLFIADRSGDDGIASGETLVDLGRALAQEAGDVQ